MALFPSTSSHRYFSTFSAGTFQDLTRLSDQGRIQVPRTAPASFFLLQHVRHLKQGADAAAQPVPASFPLS